MGIYNERMSGWSYYQNTKVITFDQTRGKFWGSLEYLRVKKRGKELQTARTKKIYVQNIFKIYNIYFTYIVDEKLYN